MLGKAVELTRECKGNTRPLIPHNKYGVDDVPFFGSHSGVIKNNLTEATGKTKRS